MSETPLGARPHNDPSQTQTQRAFDVRAGTVGPYRLLEALGGGMGELWLADQTRPMRRHVALKIVKLGMDSAQVVARFDADRQALALLDNPAIAKCSTPLRATSTFGQGGDYVPTGYHRHR
jgi:hypothetical protein